MDSRQWFYERFGQKVGPFQLDELRQLLAVGMIEPGAVVYDQVGAAVRAEELLATGASAPKEFTPAACEIPGIPPAAPRASAPSVPPPPPPPPPVTAPPASRPDYAEPVPLRAWDPRLIGLLGLVFSPIWAGIMASINGRRLRMQFPLWQPVAIGLGATLLDVLVSVAVIDNLLFDLALYVGALVWIWGGYLAGQVGPYEQQEVGGSRQPSWAVPALAGSPAALVVFLAFVFAPLLPLEPREVCQRMIAADSLAEAKQYATMNLWPALSAMYAQEEDSEFEAHFELLDEGDAPVDLGGYLVAWQVCNESESSSSTVEGVFHLTHLEGKWRVEECYFTAFNGEVAEEPIRLSASYREMYSGSDETTRLASAGSGNWPLFLRAVAQGVSGEKAVASEAPALVAGGKAIAAEAKGVYAIGNGLKGSLKRIGGLLAAIAAGLAALGRWLSGSSSSTSARSGQSDPT